MTLKLPALAVAAVAALLLSGCSSAPADASTDATAGTDATSPGTGSATDSTGSSTAPASTPPAAPSGKRVTLNQAGSSTVLPIAEAFAEEYGRAIGANIVVGGGGSGAGLAKFCRGELDIADASRPIKPSEEAACKAKGIEPFEMQVAIDGLSVVVSKSNDFVQCLTVEQLNRIWTASASKQANQWSDLDPAWPDEDIDLFGPGTDSGTFDYFVEVIIAPFDGAASKGRSDYTPSEDDNILVQGVASNANGLGYFGLAYARENEGKLNVVEIDNGDGCVEPTNENVESGTYAPLSRPLFMYTDGKPEGVLAAYFNKAYSEEGQMIVEEVGYIGLPQAKLDEMVARYA